MWRKVQQLLLVECNCYNEGTFECCFVLENIKSTNTFNKWMLKWNANAVVTTLVRPIACSVHLLRNTNATLIRNTNRSFKKKYNHNCCNCFVPKFDQIHIQKLFYKQINNLNTKLFQLRYVSLQCFEEFNIVHTNYNCIYKSFGRSRQARVCCKYCIGQVFNALTHSQNDQIFEGRQKATFECVQQ